MAKIVLNLHQFWHFQCENKPILKLMMAKKIFIFLIFKMIKILQRCRFQAYNYLNFVTECNFW
ncbi:hypothetical protein SAMN02746062_00943 [Alysiella filiformis DSM 16848]|uniref:Uncharacterized protein n=1 Tax=Alysiella filiformis DSM 16848 TaxID=1120981 RepID=A0A286E9F6_9NEIS|nr:hypothetical protein SAMN02746062_00943 [Alysiella filiformis DSM 16848]